jgi:hypothetical protein
VLALEELDNLFERNARCSSHKHPEYDKHWPKPIDDPCPDCTPYQRPYKETEESGIACFGQTLKSEHTDSETQRCYHWSQQPEGDFQNSAIEAGSEEEGSHPHEVEDAGKEK